METRLVDVTDSPWGAMLADYLSPQQTRQVINFQSARLVKLEAIEARAKRPAAVERAAPTAARGRSNEEPDGTSATLAAP